MYNVVLSSKAGRYFEAAPASLQRRLDRCFLHLQNDPRRHPNTRPLKGRLAGYYRYRVGDYRVVYRIDERASDVVVVLIAHRREVYQ